MKFGLKDHVLLQLKKVFNSFPGIEEVVIYGSRALGTYREGSDIDITLKADLKFDELIELERKLDDLMLPYTIDLSIYQKLSNPELVEHIDRMGKQFYVRKTIEK
ncbi:nucleotidyltransferase domain-containing protein [Autumnicola musiva]|uniref:Nucleotidyltransferase domain-containing protein n=1 Tax=Autumnicola musiva TaxID=3075589 RepID=A0ABU3D804_9FLAO|nr:nucleotidyltransferase domain-containing protein [Zunongwangia sp. F117]MDT0677667.1 nucleotidyltransferase domain-containing protein [Zunongwangia sp. F117]